MHLGNISKERIVIFDGAMGTMIEASGIPRVCNEEICLSNPNALKDIHSAYFNAGADIITTNTFGASRIVLAEYGLEKKVVEINRAAVLTAREAVEKFRTKTKPRFIAGEMGPTSKLPTLGHISFDELFGAYAEQASALIDAGADIILIATCQDILQTKAASAAARFAMEKSGKTVPLFISVTVEKTGTMLLGTEPLAAISVIAPYKPDAFGINCALGPDVMEETLLTLSHNSPFPIICRPNAGIPENISGRPVYPLGPEKFADALSQFAEKIHLSFVGGCCGTTPHHIKELARRACPPKLLRRAPCVKKQTPSVSSLYKAIELDQTPRPFVIAEQLNVNGSKKFRGFLLSNDYDAMAEEGRKAAAASHALDVCAAYAGRDELKDISEIARRLALKSTAALMIDSTNPDVVETALKLIPGRSIINSINLEDGGKKARRVLKIAKRFGAAVAALTIDENGMAKRAEEKIAIARRLTDLAAEEGIEPDDIFIDPLTFTLASGDESLRGAAVETLKAIRAVKREIKDVRTILGVSNISFGLTPPVRKILTSVFLSKALTAGLDAAIINPGRIAPLHTIPKEDIDLCERLIENDHSKGDPLEKIIEHCQSAGKTQRTIVKKTADSEELLKSLIFDGTTEGLKKIIGEVLEKREPAYVINNILLPAMQDIGKLFGDGKLPLPFVLQSAEAMRAAFDIISPRLKGKTAARGKLVLATVRGDVHDIGKNLVDIILSNNGFEVVNLGIRQPAEAIIEAVMKHGAGAIGLSGLLVSSTEVMREDMEVFKHHNLKIPILCGGAALTKTFVDGVLAKSYGSDVHYCKDAFAGLEAMQLICRVGT